MSHAAIDRHAKGSPSERRIRVARSRPQRGGGHHDPVQRLSEKAEERAAALREEMVKTEALLLSASEAIDDARAERVARGSDYHNERKRQGTYKLDHYSEQWVTMNFRIY